MKLPQLQIKQPKLKYELDYIYDPWGDRKYALKKDGDIVAVADSVTTIIGEGKDNRWGIDNWRAEIGIQNADRISWFAPWWGNIFHHSVESLWVRENGSELFESHLAKNCLSQFKAIYGLETKLMTTIEVEGDPYHIAGTPDIWGETHEGKIVLVDWKTLTRTKEIDFQEGSEGSVHNYDGSVIDRSPQGAKKTKWRKQLAFYTKLIEDNFSITVDEAQLWCYNVMQSTISCELSMAQAELHKKFNTVCLKAIERYLQNQTNRELDEVYIDD
jgi:hypothetical protein